jgi:hypothetical protein
MDFLSVLIEDMEGQLCPEDFCLEKQVCTTNPQPQCTEFEERIECLE